MKTLGPLAALLLASCGPPVLRGNADMQVRALLEKNDSSAAELEQLLAANAEVHRASGTVQGARAGASALLGVKPDGQTRLYRHHDVSLMVLGDGRVLFMQRDASDKVSRAVELRSPAPGDPFPQTAVYYDRAWNADDANARGALLKAIWDEKGRYVDPMADVGSPDAVSKMIGNFRFIFPGAKVKSTSGVADAGGGWVTFDWVIVSRLGRKKLFTGFDVARVNSEGKIELLAGFFGTRYPQ